MTRDRTLTTAALLSVLKSIQEPPLRPEASICREECYFLTPGPVPARIQSGLMIDTLHSMDYSSFVRVKRSETRRQRILSVAGSPRITIDSRTARKSAH